MRKDILSAFRVGVNKGMSPERVERLLQTRPLQYNGGLVNSEKRQRVVCGMSGGVDSSTAAALLVEQGYDVIGVTLKLWKHDCFSPDEDQFKCCGSRAAADVRAVCDHLGIPFHLIDEAEEFQKQVISRFAAEYRAGRTPNPCILCNEHLKFGTLLQRADQFGAQYVATGHYARVERVGAPTSAAIDPARARSAARTLSAQARTRPAQGPELLFVFAPAGSTGPRAVPGRRPDQERHARSRPPSQAQDRR